jgi:hypothetical protein
MTYGSNDDNDNDSDNGNATPNRKDKSKTEKKKTEIEKLKKTSFVERPENYFSDPVINFSEFKKSSFLQIENLIINDVKQW